MSLPSGYTRIGCIKSSGTQYIDTGVVPNENTKVLMDFQLLEAGTGNRCLFGVVGQFSFRWFGGSSVFRTNGNVYVDFPGGIDALSRHTVEKTATETTVDDMYSVTTVAGSVSLSLYLLAQHMDNGTSNYAKAKLFSCQIYNGDTLIRDFIPAKNASGAVGLWDDVNSTFYTDAAGGSFEDPTIPTGDHNTLIDGVACGIEGGTVLIGGTAYELKRGFAMMDGVELEIVFASAEPVVITITGDPDMYYRSATINKKDIYKNGTYEYEEMPTISVYVKATGTGSSETYTGVHLNGTKVKSGSGTYDLQTKDRNITINFESTYHSNEGITVNAARITTS